MCYNRLFCFFVLSQVKIPVALSEEVKYNINIISHLKQRHPKGGVFLLQ